MRKRRQVLQAVIGRNHTAWRSDAAGDAFSATAATGTRATAVPEHDHSGPESGGDSLRPAFASIEREPTHVLLTEFVEGEGTWGAPYTSGSGTGGLREAVDEHGPHTTILAPPGVYSFTSAFETITGINDFRLIGSGNGHPEHDPSKDDQPRNTIFRLDHRPDDPKKGSIIHAIGEGRSHMADGSGDTMIFGWELRNFRIINGTAESFGDDRTTATGIRIEWCPVNRVSEITIGGPLYAQGFDRGILVNQIFKFTWSEINGKKNRIMIDSDRSVNQGVLRGIYGKPESRNDEPGAVLRLRDDFGRSDNLAGAKPRGLVINGVGGDASDVRHGLILEGAMGVDVFAPHIERALGSAVLVDVTEDDVRSRSVGIYGGFFHDCDTAVEVRGGHRVLVDGPYIQTPGRQDRDTTAVSVGSMSEHTRLQRLNVHRSVDTEVDDSGAGTTRNGMGIVSGSGGTPPAENWEPGDVVEVTGSSGSGLYQLMADGDRWYELR